MYYPQCCFFTSFPASTMLAMGSIACDVRARMRILPSVFTCVSAEGPSGSASRDTCGQTVVAERKPKLEKVIILDIYICTKITLRTWGKVIAKTVILAGTSTVLHSETHRWQVSYILKDIIYSVQQSKEKNL